MRVLKSTIIVSAAFLCGAESIHQRSLRRRLVSDDKENVLANPGGRDVSPLTPKEYFRREVTKCVESVMRSEDISEFSIDDFVSDIANIMTKAHENLLLWQLNGKKYAKYTKEWLMGDSAKWVKKKATAFLLYDPIDENKNMSTADLHEELDHLEKELSELDSDDSGEYTRRLLNNVNSQLKRRELLKAGISEEPEHAEDDATDPDLFMDDADGENDSDSEPTQEASESDEALDAENHKLLKIKEKIPTAARNAKRKMDRERNAFWRKVFGYFFLSLSVVLLLFGVSKLP